MQLGPKPQGPGASPAKLIVEPEDGLLLRKESVMPPSEAVGRAGVVGGGLECVAAATPPPMAATPATMPTMPSAPMPAFFATFDGGRRTDLVFPVRAASKTRTTRGENLSSPIRRFFSYLSAAAKLPLAFSSCVRPTKAAPRYR